MEGSLTEAEWEGGRWRSSKSLPQSASAEAFPHSRPLWLEISEKSGDRRSEGKVGVKHIGLFSLLLGIFKKFVLNGKPLEY